MTPPDTQSVLAARRRRVTRLRKQVTALAIALFIALWGVIFYQLVSGHDPVLSAKASTTSLTSTASYSTSTSTPIKTSASGSTSTTSSPAATSSSATPASSSAASSSSATPLTTSQS
jgi:cytoskeletal protein RodZ